MRFLGGGLFIDAGAGLYLWSTGLSRAFETRRAAVAATLRRPQAVLIRGKLLDRDELDAIKGGLLQSGR